MSAPNQRGIRLLPSVMFSRSCLYRQLLLIRAALSRFRRIAIGHHHDFLKSPHMIAQASGHAGSDSQRLVNTGKVVMYGADRNHCLVI